MFDGQGFIGHLDGLADAKTAHIGPRPNQLCSPCQVLLRLGETVRQQELDSEGWASISAQVSALSASVHGMQLCRVRGGAGVDGVLVSFRDTNEGVLGRQSLLDRDDITFAIGGRDIPAIPTPVRARLPPGAATITLFRFPFEYMRVGMGEALLRAAGYDEGCEVVAEFLGDPPGGPSARRSGSLPNTEVLVVIVVPPATDPTLAALPQALDMGMGVRVPVRVSTRVGAQQRAGGTDGGEAGGRTQSIGIVRVPREDVVAGLGARDVGTQSEVQLGTAGVMRAGSLVDVGTQCGDLDSGAVGGGVMAGTVGRATGHTAGQPGTRDVPRGGSTSRVLAVPRGGGGPGPVRGVVVASHPVGRGGVGGRPSPSHSMQQGVSSRYP